MLRTCKVQWLDISLGNLNLAAGPWFDVRALRLTEEPPAVRVELLPAGLGGRRQVEHWVVSAGAAGEPGRMCCLWLRPLSGPGCCDLGMIPERSRARLLVSPGQVQMLGHQVGSAAVAQAL